MKTVNFIGCGAVGRTLGRLFHQAGLFRIGDLLTRSLSSAQAAAQFIGAGRPVAGWSALRPADLFILAVSDDALAPCAAELAASGVLGPGTVVCHLSGALPSSVLAPAAGAGAAVASIHPVQSFADPAASAASFPGTWCGMEGDPAATEMIAAAFADLGARIFTLDPRFKTLYHAGSVLVCNYLTCLIETGVRSYQKGGLSRQEALQVMEPLVRGTLDNVFRVGTVGALTGPIARGDSQTVEKHLAALDDWDGDIARVYRALGIVALELSRERGAASQEDLARLAALLGGEGAGEGADRERKKTRQGRTDVPPRR